MVEPAKKRADIDDITADAADKAVKILTDNIIDPLREQVTYQVGADPAFGGRATQVFQGRGLCAQPVPLAAIILRGRRPEFLKRHPKAINCRTSFART